MRFDDKLFINHHFDWLAIRRYMRYDTETGPDQDIKIEVQSANIRTNRFTENYELTFLL